MKLKHGFNYPSPRASKHQYGYNCVTNFILLIRKYRQRSKYFVLFLRSISLPPHPEISISSVWCLSFSLCSYILQAFIY